MNNCGKALISKTDSLSFYITEIYIHPDGLNIIIFYMNGRAHGKDADIEMFIVLLLGIKLINFIG